MLVRYCKSPSVVCNVCNTTGYTKFIDQITSGHIDAKVKALKHGCLSISRRLHISPGPYHLPTLHMMLVFSILAFTLLGCCNGGSISPCSLGMSICATAGPE